jgi:hypothetical protein
MSDIWEPWRPGIGQWVRFQRGECPRPHGGIRTATGVIVPCGSSDTHIVQAGHRFHVELDMPVETVWGRAVQVIAAAAELVPL